jgi:outer membrane protein assembly factor BamB
MERDYSQSSRVAASRKSAAVLKGPIGGVLTRRRYNGLAVLWSLSALISFSARAEDWPHFLGPRSNGTSSETNLIDSFGPKGPPMVWQKDVGAGYSAPSIRDGKLVLHHRLGNEEIVQAYSLPDGKELWHYGYPTSFIDPYGYSKGPRCTPLLTTNRCYTFGAEGKLLCLDFQTGKPVWQRDTQKEWDIPEAFFGVGSTPILEGNRLIVMIGGQSNSGMAAFDPETGKTLWESVGEKNWQGQPMIGWPGDLKVDWPSRFRYDKQASYATPVAATVNGERQIFCFMRQGLVSVKPENGEVNFSYFFRARVDESVNAMDPVVIGNQVLISAAYYKVGAVLLKVLPGNKQVESVWRSTALEIHFTTPIYHNGYLYAFSGRNPPDAHFRCVEYQTGKIMWDRDERWGGRGVEQTYGRGSAVMADGKLIVLGETGILGLFRVNPERPEELARYLVPEMKYPCWTAPVLSDKKVYLRSDNKLICFDFGRQK